MIIIAIVTNNKQPKQNHDRFVNATMKKVLIIFFLFNLTNSYCQTTNIADPNFEQALIDLGYDNIIDGTVVTSAIDTVTVLDISNLGISDIGGIEGFANLESFTCSYNPIGQFDLSNNSNLKHLWCDSCELTTLDITSNPLVNQLSCSYNNFTQLDLTQNLDLWFFIINFTNIEALDLSNNGSLFYFECNYNPFLSCLNLKVGNSLYAFNGTVRHNPLLTCIDVDNPSYWYSVGPSSGMFDGWISFSTNCNNSCSPILDLTEINSQPKKLIQIIDLMGRKVEDQPNTVLIYVYSDGTTEKVFRVK